MSREPELRAAASDLLQHPFVTGEYLETHPVFRTSVMETSENRMATPRMDVKNSITCTGLKDVRDLGSVRSSNIYPANLSGTGSNWRSNDDDDMCQIDDDLVIGEPSKFGSVLLSDDLNKSFNPMSEPNDDWPCKFDESPELSRSRVNSVPGQTIHEAAGISGSVCKADNDFTFPSGPFPAEDDDEVTESKIRAFLDEKAALERYLGYLTMINLRFLKEADSVYGELLLR